MFLSTLTLQVDSSIDRTPRHRMIQRARRQLGRQSDRVLCRPLPVEGWREIHLYSIWQSDIQYHNEKEACLSVLKVRKETIMT